MKKILFLSLVTLGCGPKAVTITPADLNLLNKGVACYTEASRMVRECKDQVPSCVQLYSSINDRIEEAK